MTAVWALALPDSEKIVLLALADSANDEGHCWPGMKSLIVKCSKSERTIQGAVQRLVDAGHLTRREVLGKGCNYTVHPRSDCARQEAADTPAATAPRSDCPPQGTAQTPAATAGKPLRTTNTEAKASLIRVFEHWNKTAVKRGLHRAGVLNASRTQMGLARLKEHGEAKMIDAIDRCGRSPFCRGETGDGRRADIMMILQPKTLTRLFEGYYGEDEAKGQPIDPKAFAESQRRTAELYDRLGRTNEAAEIRAALDRKPDPAMAARVAGLASGSVAKENFSGGAAR